jgi:outer membrane biosynthesis protein TonB
MQEKDATDSEGAEVETKSAEKEKERKQKKEGRKERKAKKEQKAKKERKLKEKKKSKQKESKKEAKEVEYVENSESEDSATVKEENNDESPVAVTNQTQPETRPSPSLPSRATTPVAEAAPSMKLSDYLGANCYSDEYDNYGSYLYFDYYGKFLEDNHFSRRMLVAGSWTNNRQEQTSRVAGQDLLVLYLLWTTINRICF